MIAVVAEKPSVARDIAAVLGARARREAALEGNGYRVCWAIGHLVGLCEPHEVDPAWKSWRLESLPMLPRAWPLKALEETRGHFESLARLLNDPEVERVVCATDAGREGELIFRYVYRLAGCAKPVERLWISALTPQAIRAGFASLRPSSDFDRLADAADGRARADWLVGMNLTRLYTVRFGPDLLSVGRVQTPTLAMLCERERAIARFVPEHYCEVVATFGDGRDAYRGTWFDPAGAADGGAGEGEKARPAQRLPADGERAAAIRERCQGQQGEIASMSGSDRSLPPPLLYDLTELQRHANRLFGLTAKATLDVAQALYERHKLLSYPRTDSRHLSQAIAPEACAVALALAPQYGERAAPGTGARPLSARFVDDARVSDHHALIPTGVAREGKSLSRDEERVYDLVCRRLLMAWHADHRTRVTQVVTKVRSADAVDRFRSSGTVVTQVGWKALDLEPERSAGRRPAAAEEDRALPEGLAEGQRRPARKVEVLQRQTEPPRRFTDATLLTAMETAGRSLESRELEEAMRERGLGTPATRAAILETLLARGYAERRGKSLWATERGQQLVEWVHESVKSPQLTGEWELLLKRLEKGEGTLAGFMRRIEQLVIDVVGQVRQGGAGASAAAPSVGAAPGTPAARTSAPGGGLSIARGGSGAEGASAAGPAGPSGARGVGAADAPGDRRAGARGPSAPGEVPVLAAPDGAGGGRAAAGGPSAPSGPGAVRDGEARASGARGGQGGLGLPGREGELPLRMPEPGERAGGRAPPPQGSTAPDALARLPPRPPIAAAPRAAGLPGAPAEPPGEARPPAPPAVSAGGESLARLLRERFGFRAFRPYQEEVMEAVAGGQSALLVMPTGSGKSLCYQLPGVARGGTTVVISPLIALMEDQTAKLTAMGLRADRVHSGRTRDQSRAACRAYLDGGLDFLTIAPERLSVPGFPEMLARRPPALVAVDEAHCISHWGHDFRPDYRLLGERLPLFRPAPVIALTATATVRVQDDILAQLGIPGARRFIRGFRRDNLAIEAYERPRGERLGEVVATLAQPGRLPAVVYVPTRKLAEDIAETLAGTHRAAAYHAGLVPAERARTQEAFLAGELEVIVATIAFGMGIDKADVRTVIHLALPGTVEGYYQEIGRAGRDGKPARALLLYSFGDRKVHESFLERDYPETSVLEGLRARVPASGIGREALLAGCRLPPEVAEPALDKLWIHGGVAVDGEDRVRLGREGWQRSYEAIRAYRKAQLDEIVEFAESSGCRMARLVRHFGDTHDRHPCGQCDHCRPGDCIGRSFRAPDAADQRYARRIIEELERYEGVSTGTLYRALHPGDDAERRRFERMLQALVRAEALVLSEDAFEKEGKTIRFRRATLRPGARARLESQAFQVEEPGSGEGKKPARKHGAAGHGKKPERRRKGEGLPQQAQAAGADPGAVQRLREWRRALARQRGIPAFRILTDSTLLAIAAERPRTLSELLHVRGAGPKLIEKHGAAILAELARAGARA